MNPACAPAASGVRRLVGEFTCVFSPSTRRLALVRPASLTATSWKPPSLALERGHAEALLPLIDRVVASVERGFPGLDRIAVTIGPGSYTGLRVGIAAARAIGLAAGVPVLGVTTSSAFLAPLAATDGNRLYAAAIDARHGQVYFQGIAPGGRTTIPPCLVTLRDAARSLSGPGRRPSRGPARPWSQRKPARQDRRRRQRSVACA